MSAEEEDKGIAINAPWGDERVIVFDTTSMDFSRGVEVGLMLSELMEFASAALEMEVEEHVIILMPENTEMAVRAAEALGLNVRIDGKHWGRRFRTGQDEPELLKFVFSVGQEEGAP